MSALLRSATAQFAGTRIANGVLALVATAVPVALVGTADAGRYFALWTATWICSVAARFGTDLVLPRIVAEGGDASAVQHRLAFGAIACALVATPVCAVLGVELTPSAIGIVTLTALVWGWLLVVAGWLRAQQRVVAAGVVANVVWSITSLIGPLAAAVLVASPSPLALLLGTLTAGVLALAGVVGVVGVGRLRLRVPRGAGATWRTRSGDEAAGGAVLATLVEVSVWSPMIFAGLAGLEPAPSAAVFAATRVAGVASWGYQAVVATTGPRLAQAVAAADPDLLRRLIVRAMRLGIAVTAPLVLIGLLVAEFAVELLAGASIPAAADVLRLLLVARLIDAATGPIGEAFTVGRRVWLDAGLVVTGLLAGAALALFGAPTVLVVGLAAAGSSVLTNLLRLGLYMSGSVRLGRPRGVLS